LKIVAPPDEIAATAIAARLAVPLTAGRSPRASRSSS
jgi:hypothetical protein